MKNTEQRLCEATPVETISRALNLFHEYVKDHAEGSTRNLDRDICNRAVRALAALAAPETGDKILREALAEAIEDIESWASYADTYFQKKHDLAGCLAKHRAALAAPETGDGREGARRRQVAFDGSPADQILRLRANLRSVTDAYESLLDEGQFPPKGRSNDDKESRAGWWEDATVRIKLARQALKDCSS